MKEINERRVWFNERRVWLSERRNRDSRIHYSRFKDLEVGGWKSEVRSKKAFVF